MFHTLTPTILRAFGALLFTSVLAACDGTGPTGCDTDECSEEPASSTFRADREGAGRGARRPCSRLLHVEARVSPDRGADRLFVASAIGCIEAQEGLTLAAGPGPWQGGWNSHETALPTIAPGGCAEVAGESWADALESYVPMVRVDGDWPSYHVVLLDANLQIVDSLEFDSDAPTAPLTQGPSGTWYEGLAYAGCQYTKDAP